MNTIIIAPFAMHKDLLSKVRKDNPFLKCKIMSKEDLISQVYGEFSVESRIELMKEMNITYDLATELVSYLPFIYKQSNERINELLTQKDALIKNGHYERNSLIDIAFKGKEVIIYGYSKNDKLLIEALKRIKCSYRFFDDKVYAPTNMSVYHFEKVEDEVFYVLNQIADLIKKGVSSNDIYIYNVDETYGYYLSLYQDSFNLKINNLPRPNMFLSGFSSDFFKLFEESKDVNLALEKLEEMVGKEKGEDVDYIQFKNAILGYIYPDISYEMQKDILASILKKKTFKSPYYQNGIKVINEPIIVENKHIFIMCFALNSVPKVYKDDAYFSNLEKEDTFIEKSTDLTLIEKDLALAFINSNNHFYYSFSSNSLSNKYYPSSFILDHKAQIIDKDLDEVIYSKKMLDYKYAQKLDLYMKYQEVSHDYLALNPLYNSFDYRTYDNSYTGVNANDMTKDMKYSYTSIDLYKKCPFAYYVNYVLNFEDFEDTFYTTLGNIIHKTFEHVYDVNYDFEDSFDKAIKSYPELTKLDLIHIERVKKQLKIALEKIQEHYKQDEIKRSAKYEYKTFYKIDNNSILEGKIDKIIRLDSEHYMVVDYKSSHKSFDKKYLDEGIGLQLPIYYLLLSENKNYKNDKIAGLYYQQTIDKNFDPYIPYTDKDINYLMLDGVTISNNVNIDLLDYTLKDPDSKSPYIQGLSKDKENKENVTQSKSLGKQELDDIKQLTINIVNDTNLAIRQNKFDISPYWVDSFHNYGCIYCKYRDICYVKKNQFRNIRKNEDDNNASNNNGEAIEA